MDNSLKGLGSEHRKDYLLILSILFLSLAIGILTVDDYGLSWDENDNISYSEIVIKAYQGSEDFLREGRNAKYYGPFYWIVVYLLYGFVKIFLFNVKVIHIWKISCFIVFELAVFTLYKFCRTFVKETPALIASLLFMTQPLLWGHAFINHKDIPLMTFFLLSITLGLHGFDTFNDLIKSSEGIQRKSVKGSIHDRWRERWLQWKAAKKQQKITLIAMILLVALLSVELIFLRGVFLPIIQSTIRDAYVGESIDLINSLFNQIAQGAANTPVESYLAAITRLYNLISGLLIIGLILAARYIYQRIFFREHEVTDHGRAGSRIWFLLIPGIVFGLTISIRVAGIYAGILVSGYFLYRSGRKAILPLIVYWIVAACVTYATWPYLWGAPIPRLLESIQEAGSFSSLTTLFQGEIQASENMPIHYLPFLLVTQLTEPALILILLGLVIMLRKWRRHDVETVFPLLLGAWIAVPILAEVVLRVPIYDNFRQFLFIVPPLILIAGWGISYLYERVKPNWLAVMILMMVLLPGIWGIVNLHPYEYVYYNVIVGGVSGAYGEYELDYWCTSLKEAMMYLQDNATPNASVYISGPVDAAIPYAREDLKFVSDRSRTPYPEYVVACRNVVLSEEFYPEYEVIHEVGIDEGVFTVIKKRVYDQ